MKKLVKILLIALVIIIVGLAGALAYIRYRLPNVGPAPELTVKTDPETLKRGEYLVKHVSGCVACHGQRDESKFAAPLLADKAGQGHKFLGREDGFPGVVYAPNITPVGLRDWTDGEVFRAITTGVAKNGRPLFPIMPYTQYRQMDEEDIKAIIAYLRTLPAGGSQWPRTELDFPLSLIVHTMPQQAALTKRPDPSDAVAYGRYMTTAAVCTECHTPAGKRGPDESRAFAGGNEFKLRDGSIVRSANITPDFSTGIGSMRREDFISRFKAYDPAVYQPRPAVAGEMNTVMPWTEYAGMTEQDLGAIYDYLRTVKPIVQRVEKFKPPARKAAIR